MSSPPSGAHEGYLVLADISGYTGFLTGTEVEHAQAIMEEIISRILAHVRAPFKLVKLEGDAVFFYAPGAALPDAERLLDALEACYCDFRDHLMQMHRSTTCQCAACRAIPTLDLKFLAHYGSYLVQRLAGTEDLAGPDVILVHRLLKNGIVEQTGTKAYLFFTDACRSHLRHPLDLPRYSTDYEHLGTVAGSVEDLTARWQAQVEARRVYVTPEEADWQFELLLPAPPPVAWHYLVAPDKAVIWRNQTTVENRRAANGRMQTGAAIHCAHGKLALLHEFVDWRPFQYFTEQGRKDSPGFAPQSYSPWQATVELLPEGATQTRLRFRGRWVERGGWRTLLRSVMSAGASKEIQTMYARLAQLLAAEAAQFAAPPDPA
jgi:hypothetical protein